MGPPVDGELVQYGWLGGMVTASLLYDAPLSGPVWALGAFWFPFASVLTVAPGDRSSVGSRVRDQTGTGFSSTVFSSFADGWNCSGAPSMGVSSCEDSSPNLCWCPLQLGIHILYRCGCQPGSRSGSALIGWFFPTCQTELG